MSLLEVTDLTVRFGRSRAVAVDGISFALGATDRLGIIGQSGSGKSVTALAVMGLLPWTAVVRADRMVFDGHDLVTMSARERPISWTAATSCVPPSPTVTPTSAK